MVKGILGERAVFLLSVGIILGSAVPSALGWYVREVGRKPWTVYGLLYPDELVSVFEPARSGGFALFMALVIASVVFSGLLAMYIVATRGRKSEELSGGDEND